MIGCDEEGMDLFDLVWVFDAILEKSEDKLKRVRH